MSETDQKHTSGPWKARRSCGVLGGEVERWAIDGPPQGLAGRWWVASMISDEPRDAANAHLIAAAPDYHAAAMEMILRHDAEAQAANFDKCGCDNCKPFRAIAVKAEGRS